MLFDQRSGPALADEVLLRLRDVCQGGGLSGLASTMEGLVDFARDDLAAVERELASLPVGGTLTGSAGARLIRLGGKRLRPLCVVLASRIGAASPSVVRDIAVAAELVHNATLLHDDVVDNADCRRGHTTARVELGNAASIFAGDHLLIEALKRVLRAGVPGAMEGLLATIAEMIRAESLQLENRGRLDTSEALYFEIARGKSAALFRWALGAGALTGGARPEVCAALEAYGEAVGVAFQVIDDLLDLVGHRSNTGKTLFSDLSEGKVTYPLIVALGREPELADTVRAIADGHGASRHGAGYRVDGTRVDGTGFVSGLVNGEAPVNGQLSGGRQRVLEAMTRHGVEETCRALASTYVEQGVAALAEVPDGEARQALTAVAHATALRER